MGHMTGPLGAGYPPLLLQHHRDPCGRAPVACPTHTADGDNPLCGDRLRLSVLVREESLAAIECRAEGCAISRASASILAELLTGRQRVEGLDLAAQLLALFGSEPDAPGPELPPGLSAPSVVALLSVRRFPGRTRCATLSWETLLRALKAPQAA